jgi:hypothetical protein
MRRESGFALIAALLAVSILTAVGVLVFTVTTQDVRISSRMVGEKKAFFAAETGIHRLTQGFDPLDLGRSVVNGVQVDTSAEGDPRTRYTIATPVVPTQGPAAIPMTGYAVGGGQQWGATRFLARVTGTNTGYQTSMPVEVGVGYGPMEITTAYR